MRGAPEGGNAAVNERADTLIPPHTTSNLTLSNFSLCLQLLLCCLATSADASTTNPIVLLSQAFRLLKLY